jgi:xylulokinase
MAKSGYLLGYDLGSSSIKASVLETDTGRLVASATSPRTEMEIIANKPGWAEQHPDTWWEHLKNATAEIRSRFPAELRDVRAVGISYQMHGLVMVGSDLRPVAPAIIWCDSRAVEIGNAAFQALGPEKCLRQVLNSPGNFTASRVKWVKDNQPEIYRKIFRIMLPGDYIALKLTGRAATTPAGLSEGIMWDFIHRQPADFVLDYCGIPREFIPDIVPVFSTQGEISAAAAAELGLTPGIPVAYRAGDQPNNALSLNVLQPGEIAATAGTSGVVYGVTDKARADQAGRVNAFVPVNDAPDRPRYGILLCVNGTGILYRWVRDLLAGPNGDLPYRQLNELAAGAPAGSDGLLLLPYGNGAERTLENRNIHASLHGLDYTRHRRAHLVRAAQEGIVFALCHGLDVMRDLGLSINRVRAGQANLFQSPLFAEVFATVADTGLQLFNTDGSQGAARGAGIGAGIYRNPEEAFANLAVVKEIIPNQSQKAIYTETYETWREIVRKQCLSSGDDTFPAPTLA